MQRIIQLIGPLHATIIILMLAGMAILLISPPARAETVPCFESYGQVSMTADIVISGDPWTEPGGYYSARGDKVTMTFEGGNIITVTVDADEKFTPAARIISWLETASREGNAKAILDEKGNYGLLIGDPCSEGVLMIGPRD